MTNKLRNVCEKLLADVEKLPFQSDEEIAAAARHLSMMAFQCPVDFTEKDFLFLAKEDIRRELVRIRDISPEELRRNPSQVEEWQEHPAEEDVELNRIRRMEFLFREFEGLTRLRANDPKEWDKINELYYDD